MKNKVKLTWNPLTWIAFIVVLIVIILVWIFVAKKRKRH